jgi:hypothetical protein
MKKLVKKKKHLFAEMVMELSKSDKRATFTLDEAIWDDAMENQPGAKAAGGEELFT